MFYQILTSRGCPYGCSFCINNYVKKLHRGQKTYRRRFFDNVFQELEQARNRFPIELVMISDDSFFACSEDELEAFAEEYKRRINIPFRCLATPKNVTERKLKTLVDAGMIWLEVGIQSCAPETLKMYRRQWGGVEEIRRAAKILAPFQEQIEVFYDIIIDNPWEPVKDTVQTLREVVELPRPYRMQLFSLTLFPGTELYERGVQEGLVKDIHKEIYQKQYFVREFTYLSFVLSLIYRNLPQWILRIMLSGPAIAVFHRAYMKPIFKAGYGFVRLLRMLKHLLLPQRRIVVEKSDGNTA